MKKCISFIIILALMLAAMTGCAKTDGSSADALQPAETVKADPLRKNRKQTTALYLQTALLLWKR